MTNNFLEEWKKITSRITASKVDVDSSSLQRNCFNGFPDFSIKSEKRPKQLPEKYIINEHVCVCIWKDGIKTISKKKESDNFDKELGFLFCCYQYYYRHISRNKRSKILDWINYSSMKDFLFEIFKRKNNFTTNEAKRYLADLKVEKKKTEIDKTKTELDKSKNVNEKVEELEKKIQFLIEENERLKKEKESYQKYDYTRKPKHAMED